MDGIEVPQDWELAYEFLSKSVIDKDNESTNHQAINNVQEVLRLGLFYCISPIPWQNVDKCIEHFDTEAYYERSHTERKSIYEELYVNLARAIINGHYSDEDKTKLQKFLKEELDFTHFRPQLEDQNVGVFKFVEGEKFRDKDGFQYDENVDVASIIPDETSRVGAKFTVDVEGLREGSYTTGIAIRWLKQIGNQPKKPIYNKLLYGSARENWSTMWNLSDIEKDTIMTLQIFSPDQTLLLEQDFFVTSELNELQKVP